MASSSPIVLAIRRAADLLGYFIVPTPGGRHRILSDLASIESSKTYRTPQVLAVLAEQCMMPVRIGGLGLTPEELAERIQWSGPVPRRGVSPYQEAVLERVASAAGAGVPS